MIRPGINVSPGCNSGLAICWIEVNRNGTFAYVKLGRRQRFSFLANPYAPTEIQKLELDGPKELLQCPTPDPCAPVIFATTPFQLELDPTGTYLYVLNHETTFETTSHRATRYTSFAWDLTAQ